MGEPFAKTCPVKTISLDLTEDCTCRCSYCFCGEKTRAVMDEATARRVIDWLLSPETSGNERNVQVDFWGGEPLMRWDLAREIISYGNRQAERVGKKIRWNMTTNGVCFTERVAEDMKLAGVSFMLSLDGAKPTQDKCRPLAGEGSSYDVIVRNLPNMRAVNPNIRVRMTVQEEDVGRMYENVLHMHQVLGIQEISHCLAHETAWSHESLVELERQLRLIADYYVEQKRRGNAQFWVKFIDDSIGRLLYPRRMNYFCGAGKGYVSVSVEGAVYACHRFHEFTDLRPWQEQYFAMGHVEEGLTKPEVRAIFLTSNRRLEFCRGCALAQAGTCTGTCYAVNYIKSGHDIAIPAHSQCAEMRMIQGIAAYVYNQLVGVPAFKATLARAARERWRPQGCLAPGPGCDDAQESLDIDIKGTVNELGVLRSALAAIREACAAAEEVLATGISEREWRLDLLEQLRAIAQGTQSRVRDVG